MAKRWAILGLLLSPFFIALYAMFGGGIGEASWLGMTVDELNRSEEAAFGVPANVGRVVVVRVEGAAMERGVMVRDVVLGINGRPVDSINTFLESARAVLRARSADGLGNDVVLTLNRFGRPLTVTVPAEVVAAGSRR